MTKDHYESDLAFRLGQLAMDVEELQGGRPMSKEEAADFIKRSNSVTRDLAAVRRQVRAAQGKTRPR